MFQHFQITVSNILNNSLMIQFPVFIKIINLIKKIRKFFFNSLLIILIFLFFYFLSISYFWIIYL